ncbi:MAG: sortase [Chloroflexota bacterium]
MSGDTDGRRRALAWLILAAGAVVLVLSAYRLAVPETPVPPSAPAISLSPVDGGAAVATRVVIPSLGIDLPVVSGDVRVPDQGPPGYPPCDVALYLTGFRQPGERGTTYLYAHARPGMFLPLLEASETDDGASLLDATVEVYTSDEVRHEYRISRVKRHALDLSLAQDIPARSQRLVLQTSEGPRGTAAKLQVLAVPVATASAAPGDAHPRAAPRGCYAD